MSNRFLVLKRQPRGVGHSDDGDDEGSGSDGVTASVIVKTYCPNTRADLSMLQDAHRLRFSRGFQRILARLRSCCPDVHRSDDQVSALQLQLLVVPGVWHAAQDDAHRRHLQKGLQLFFFFFNPFTAPSVQFPG